MRTLWPTIREERLMALRREARSWPLADRAAVAVRFITPWRSNGPVLSTVFFVLTALAVGAAFFLFDALGLPKGWLTAAIAIAVAEFLILRRRWFGTGVEPALWIGGLVAVIAGMEGPARAEVLLLFAAAALLSGLRVRSALLAGIGVALIVMYLGAKQWWMPAFGVAMALAIAALFALRREWQRPSTERFLAALVLIMPVAAAYATGDRLARWVAIAHLALAAIDLVCGLRWRLHAPLAGAFINLVIAAVELHDLLDLEPEWMLIGAGIVLLAVAGAIARKLRGSTTGIVVTPESLTELDDAMVPGVAAITAGPAAHTTPEEQHRGGGGSFGGAGASSEF